MIFVFPDHTHLLFFTKIVSEYDQAIPQSQTADKPMVTQGRATQPSGDTSKKI